MKIIAHKFLIALILIFPIISNSEEFNKTKLNEYISLLEKHNKVMGSFAIAHAGEVFYENALGYASFKDSIKNKPDTRYRIGSITKVFTAALIFQLIEEGALTLDTKLSLFYPQIKNADKISISQMLYHKSGLYNYTDSKKINKIRFKPETKRKLVKLISKCEPLFEPGEKFTYSNTNYLLLGFIVEDVTKKTYPEVLEQKITKPLGLDNTYFCDKPDINKNEASSYYFADNKWNDAYNLDMNVAYSAGGITSTTKDLIKFVTALFDGRIISKESIDEMIKTEEDWGRGIFKFRFEDKYSYGHNGAIEGFNSHLAYFPEEKMAICQLTNGLNYLLNNTSLALLSVYYNTPLELPDFNVKSIELAEEELKKFSGSYKNDTSDVQITLEVKKGVLMGRTNYEPIPIFLTPVKKNEFRHEKFGIIIEFKNNQEGEIDYSTFSFLMPGSNLVYRRSM